MEVFDECGTSRVPVLPEGRILDLGMKEKDRLGT